LIFRSFWYIKKQEKEEQKVNKNDEVSDAELRKAANALRSHLTHTSLTTRVNLGFGEVAREDLLKDLQELTPRGVQHATLYFWGTKAGEYMRRRAFIRPFLPWIVVAFALALIAIATYLFSH
jgi:hypothetical protein